MATLLRPFKWLLCQCWRLLNFVRRLVMGLLTLLLLIGIGIGIASIGSEEKKPAVEGVLVVNPTGQLVEQLSETPSSSRLLRNWLSDDTPPAETLVSDVVKATSYRIYFTSEGNEKISNENTYVADNRELSAQKRIFRLRFTFKNKKYDKDKQYYLVVYDEDTGLEQWRHPVMVDIAFADDFGFGF